MATAFVLSGGGNLGAVQGGTLIALAERGIVPDALFGTSVGAVNVAWVAGRPRLEGARALADIWRGVRRSDVFPFNPLDGFLGFIGRRNFLVPNGGLRSLLERHLVFTRLEDAPVPVSVVATEITSGEEVVLHRGDAVDAVLASAAIPGVFPPVTVEGADLMDGGIADNSPLAPAVRSGAETIYVLPTGYSCALRHAPRSSLAMALHSVQLLVQQRLVHDIARFESDAEVRVIPPLCPVSVSPVDFGQTALLIERAREFAGGWLDERHPAQGQAALLSFHDHRHG